MNPFLLMFACLVAMIIGAMLARRFGKRLACNQAPSVYNTTNLSILVSTALADRHSLVKYVDATHANPPTLVGDIPIGFIRDDSVDALDVDTIVKSVALLGQHTGTLRGVAGAAIVLNAQLVADLATPGRVKTLPVAAGTYQVIGRANSAASAAGDVIEIRHHMPISIVVP